MGPQTRRVPRVPPTSSGLATHPTLLEDLDPLPDDDPPTPGPKTDRHPRTINGEQWVCL